MVRANGILKKVTEAGNRMYHAIIPKAQHRQQAQKHHYMITISNMGYDRGIDKCISSMCTERYTISLKADATQGRTMDT